MSNWLNQIKTICLQPEFKDELADLLIELCKIDTTPKPNPSDMAKQENELYSVLESNLKKLNIPNSRFLKHRMNPAIKENSNYSFPHFTKTASNPDGLTAEEVYNENRYQLLFLVDGEDNPDGRGTAFNAHIDVVAPYIPPSRDSDIVFGRGSMDDKGGVVSVYGIMKVLSLLINKGLKFKNKLTCMFVTEEETGGNGTLTIVTDKELKKRYDSCIIMDGAGNKIYPANRGAVWFKCVAVRDEEFKDKVSLVEALVYAILEMQDEGDKLRDESNHPLYPHKPVQTCTGILGNFGEHPARVCGEIEMVLDCISGDKDKLTDAINSGLASYIERYGDKTKELDSKGNKKTDHHLDISDHGDKIEIKVHGATGHMGKTRELDPAIVKWAYIARSVLELKQNNIVSFNLILPGLDNPSELVHEGGQGFLPTHPMSEIQDRQRKAFKRGISKYLKIVNMPDSAIRAEVTYDKLHNEALTGNPDSVSFKVAWQAGLDSGMITNDDKIIGWDVSSDARLFGCEYPGFPVMSSGCGELAVAHSNEERLDLNEMITSIIFGTLFLLRETGSINE